MIRMLFALTIFLFAGCAPAAEPAAPKPADYGTRTYVGPWQTTNRKLDGIQTAVVTHLGGERWEGRFFGVWQGVAYDYTVEFSGPPERLTGKARIDGARYDWTGSITDDRFDATFGGDRYVGSFSMPRK